MAHRHPQRLGDFSKLASAGPHVIAAARHFFRRLIDVTMSLPISRIIRGFRDPCIRVVQANRCLGDVPRDIPGCSRPSMAAAIEATMALTS